MTSDNSYLVLQARDGQVRNQRPIDEPEATTRLFFHGA